MSVDFKFVGASVAPGSWLQSEYAVYHMLVTVTPPADTPSTSASSQAAPDAGDLRSFLDRHGLVQYRQSFEDNGLDNVAKLAKLTEKSSKALGLPKVHQLKLERALGTWRREHGDQTEGQKALATTTTTSAAAAAAVLAAPPRLREFQELLEASNLSHLFKAFVDVGIDSVAMLASLSPEEFSILGLKQGHTVKLNKALDEWRAAHPPAVPPPTADSHPPPTPVAAAPSAKTDGVIDTVVAPDISASESVSDTAGTSSTQLTVASAAGPISLPHRVGVEETKSSAPVDEATEALQHFMLQQNMPHMLIDLTDNGISSIAQLAALDNERLKAFGFKKAHLMKLHTPLQSWRETGSAKTMLDIPAVTAPATASAVAPAAAIPSQFAEPSKAEETLNRASATTTTTVLSELEHFLTDNGLQLHFKTFTGAGIDTTVKLASLEPSSLSQFGLKKAHYMKLKKALDEWRRKEGQLIKTENVDQIDSAATPLKAEVSSANDNIIGTEVSEFQRFLTDNGLAHLFGTFTDAGIDSTAKLAALEPSSIAALGLKKAQKMKLGNVLNAWRSSPELAKETPSAHQGGSVQSSSDSTLVLQVPEYAQLGHASDSTELSEFMEDNGLPHLSQAFIDAGLDSISKLAALDMAGLSAIGLKKAQAMKLNKALREWQRNNSDKSEPIVGGAPAGTIEDGDLDEHSTNRKSNPRATNAELAELSVFLDGANSFEASTVLLAGGINTVSKLAELSTAEMLALGLKKLQVARISKALKEYVRNGYGGTNSRDNSPHGRRRSPPGSRNRRRSPPRSGQQTSTEGAAATGATISPRTPPSDAEVLEMFLSRLKMQHFTGPFVASGLGSINKIAKLSQVELEELGIKQAHAQKLARALQNWQRTTTGGLDSNSHGIGGDANVPNELRAFLVHAQLPHCLTMFVDAGHITCAQIATLSTSDLASLGLKPAQVKKVTRAVAEWRKGHLGNLDGDECNIDGGANSRDTKNIFSQPGSYFIYRRFSDFCKLQLALSQPIEGASPKGLDPASNDNGMPPSVGSKSNSGKSGSSSDAPAGAMTSIPETENGLNPSNQPGTTTSGNTSPPLQSQRWRPLETSTVDELFPLPPSGDPFNSTWRQGVTSEKCYERGRVLEMWLRTVYSSSMCEGAPCLAHFLADRRKPPTLRPLIMPKLETRDERDELLEEEQHDEDDLRWRQPQRLAIGNEGRNRERDRERGGDRGTDDGALHPAEGGNDSMATFLAMAQAREQGHSGGVSGGLNGEVRRGRRRSRDGEAGSGGGAGSGLRKLVMCLPEDDGSSSGDDLDPNAESAASTRTLAPSRNSGGASNARQLVLCLPGDEQKQIEEPEEDREINRMLQVFLCLPSKNALEASDPDESAAIANTNAHAASIGGGGTGIGGGGGNNSGDNSNIHGSNGGGGGGGFGNSGRGNSAPRSDVADDGYMHAFQAKSRSDLRRQLAHKPLDFAAQEALEIKNRRDLFLALVELTDGYEGGDHIDVEVLIANLKDKRKTEREWNGNTKKSDELIQNTCKALGLEHVLAAEYPNITYQKTMKFLSDKVATLRVKFGSGWRKEGPTAATSRGATRAGEKGRRGGGGEKGRSNSAAADTGECRITFEMWTRILKQENEKATAEIAAKHQAKRGSSKLEHLTENSYEGNCVRMNKNHVNASHLVVIVKLKGVYNLPYHEDNYATIEPYAKFMLACSKTESMYGRQMKQGDGCGVSSSEVNYDPPLYYGFVLVPEGKPRAKLVVSLMDQEAWSEDVPMGSAVLYLKDLPVVDEGPKLTYSEATVALSDPESGDPLDMYLTIDVCVTTRDKGFDFGMETLYEYQRWSTLEQAWGNDEQDMDVTDPGIWSDQAGKYFMTLDDAAHDLPPGWQADPWRTSHSFGENGWQYGHGYPFMGFLGVLWSDSAEGLNWNLRRRIWYREIRGHPT